MSTVLVIDDDESLSSTLAVSLRGHGFAVVRSMTGELGVFEAHESHPDVVIVDLGLPKIDGLEVIRQLRKDLTVPIIVLSARHQEQTKVEALNLGADDYVTKPFGMDELVARIKATLRRGVRSDGNVTVDTGDFTVDVIAKVVVRNGEEVRLTATEWRVLEVLIAHEDRPVSHEELLQTVWPGGEAPVDYARVYVAALRRKLEADSSRPLHLLTEQGTGYRFRR